MRHLHILCGVLLGLCMPSARALAADHAEAPGTQSDPAADIADFYSWHDDSSVYAVVTFAGLTAAGGSATYDEDVVYVVNIDNNGDPQADEQILVRFGQNSAGDWGVQAEGIPGAATLSGGVETVISDGDASLWAGLRDDPFFFDLQGYLDTLSTATVSFTKDDTFAGTNVTAIVVAMSRDEIGSDFFRIWATTARK